jgi:hypothetical protein
MKCSDFRNSMVDVSDDVGHFAEPLNIYEPCNFQVDIAGALYCRCWLYPSFHLPHYVWSFPFIHIQLVSISLWHYRRVSSHKEIKVAAVNSPAWDMLRQQELTSLGNATSFNTTQLDRRNCQEVSNCNRL